MGVKMRNTNLCNNTKMFFLNMSDSLQPRYCKRALRRALSNM